VVVRPSRRDVLRFSGAHVAAEALSERIQKILATFGIDEPARDRVYFKEVLAKEGPVWIDLIKSLNIEPQ
jgi:hypothetical protein